jgi:biopolymer transport protein TolQ
MNTTATAPNLSAWSLIADSSSLVKLILLLLLFASVLTWAIIFTKMKLLKNAKIENDAFLELFWNSKTLDEVQNEIDGYPQSPIAKVFQSGFKELRKLPVSDRTLDGTPEVSNIERALNRTHAVEMDELEKYLDWLASTASAAPFVGLFGTVWGIMNSFQNIGAMGSASLAVVAPGISEALISTAVGLAAAIPAAIFYNYLLSRVKRVSLDLDTFSQDFLNMIQRSLLVTRKGAAHGNESIVQE